MVEHGGTTVIKKKRKADFLWGAVIALFIAGLGVVLSSAKAQNEEYKMNECKLKIFLEHSKEWKRWMRERESERETDWHFLPSGEFNVQSPMPPLDYSKQPSSERHIPLGSTAIAFVCRKRCTSRR